MLNFEAPSDHFQLLSCTMDTMVYTIIYWTYYRLSAGLLQATDCVRHLLRVPANYAVILATGGLKS